MIALSSYNVVFYYNLHFVYNLYMNNREPFWAGEKSNQDINKEMEGDIIEGEDFETEEEEYIREAVDGDFTFEPTRNIKNDKELIEDLYDWYSMAMQRRDRKPLYRGNFEDHFFGETGFEENFIYGNPEKGYILGITKAGIFIPTHFAPKTMRGGYELIKKLGEGSIPCVMAVTPDLVDIIKKMPEWHKHDFEYMGSFRYESVKKQIVYNDYPNIVGMLPALVAEYMNESKRRESYFDNDYDEDIEDSPTYGESEFEDAAQYQILGTTLRLFDSIFTNNDLFVSVDNMGMSNKAINKFARFTATKTPLYKYNRLGDSNLTKKGQSKVTREDLIKSISSRKPKA